MEPGYQKQYEDCLYSLSQFDEKRLTLARRVLEAILLDMEITKKKMMESPPCKVVPMRQQQ